MNLLSKLTTDFYSAGIRPRSAQVTNWFMKKVRDAGFTDKDVLKQPGERLSPTSLIGSMAFFRYDAKHKDTLPYWDQFPLVIPIDFSTKHFLGLNLHYLDYRSRAILLDKLIEFTNTPGLTPRTRMQISYEFLNASKNFKEIKPCVHMYLYTQMDSQFLHVNPSEWETALYLPVEKFVGASSSKVWKDSKKRFKP